MRKSELKKSSLYLLGLMFMSTAALAQVAQEQSNVADDVQPIQDPVFESNTAQQILQQQQEQESLQRQNLQNAATPGSNSSTTAAVRPSAQVQQPARIRHDYLGSLTRRNITLSGGGALGFTDRGMQLGVNGRGQIFAGPHTGSLSIHGGVGQPIFRGRLNAEYDLRVLPTPSTDVNPVRTRPSLSVAPFLRAQGDVSRVNAEASNSMLLGADSVARIQSGNPAGVEGNHISVEARHGWAYGYGSVLHAAGIPGPWNYNIPVGTHSFGPTFGVGVNGRYNLHRSATSDFIQGRALLEGFVNVLGGDHSWVLDVNGEYCSRVLTWQGIRFCAGADGYVQSYQGQAAIGGGLQAGMRWGYGERTLNDSSRDVVPTRAPSNATTSSNNASTTSTPAVSSAH